MNRWWRDRLVRRFAVAGVSLGALNLLVLLALALSGVWRGEVEMPTLSVQIALLTAFIVFGGFGLAALGTFGIAEIEKIALRRAEALVNERLEGLTGKTRSTAGDPPPPSEADLQEVGEKL